MLHRHHVSRPVKNSNGTRDNNHNSMNDKKENNEEEETTASKSSMDTSSAISSGIDNKQVYHWKDGTPFELTRASVCTRTLSCEEEDIDALTTTTASTNDDVEDKAPKTSTEVTNKEEHVTSCTIRLMSEEEHLFETLIAAADAYENGIITVDNFENASLEKNSTSPTCVTPPPPGCHVSIRVAGGWVRDKILGSHSHDVDIALDTMSGVQFASIVQAYLHTLAQEGKIPKSQSNKKIGVISANPNQSKHLETATMKILNIECDFVNLRAEEVYEEHSRIPTQQTKQFGTPLEDALRRDFTVNSLFYNIRTKQVEDYTNRGLDDLLMHRMIVTPLDPHTTFHDDPLRVLRAIRFCVRYDLDLDTTLREAAMSKEVHHSLHIKVSRERVGKELEGMLTGKGAKPGRALDLITELKLAGSVFCFPPKDVKVSGTVLGHEYVGTEEELAHLREIGWEEARALLQLLPQAMEAHNDELHKIEEDQTHASNTTSSNNKHEPPSVVDIRLLHLAVFLLPFRHLLYIDKKGKEQSVVSYMIKESIKYKTKDISSVVALMDHADKMQTIIRTLRDVLEQSTNHEFPSELPQLCRLETGLLLRTTKDLWVSCLLMASVAEMRDVQSCGNNSVVKNGMDDVLQTSRETYRSILNLGLDKCWKVRPLLDGRQLIKSLDLPKGPLVGVYLDDQVRWMLQHPNGSKEECERHLWQRKREREGADEEEHEISRGISDGVCPSSPVKKGNSAEENEGRHFSKKMHVESMDLM